MKTIPDLILKSAAVLACFTAHCALAETIQVTQSITNSVFWTRANEYVLNGFIYVLQGGSLHVEAGTVIKGKPGNGANTSCLTVTQGGKIFANGSRTHPIIFTAEADDVNDPDDLPIFQRGLWGGVVLLGKSVMNTASDTAGNAAKPKYDVFEGLPDSQINGQYVHRFGGNDDDDNSGILRYVSIRHAGVVFQPNKELNGLSLGAVGRGTQIEYVEIYAAADDGVEFFGGTVNTKYIVSAFNDDDCFDIDQGYRGKNQFWFGIQEPVVKDHGGEWNGEPNGIAVGASPIANYEIYNATWIGAGTNVTGNRALMIREYAAPKLYNSILTEFGGPAVRIDDKSAVHLTNGLLDLRDNVWWKFGTNGVSVPLVDSTSAVAAGVVFSDASRNNVVADPMLRGVSRTNNGVLDPRPVTSSPALSSARTAPNDGFYTPVAYKGAFDQNENWLVGWTFLSQKGFLGVAAVHPTLTIGREGSGLNISLESESGASYQLQSTTDLSSAANGWTDEGAALPGNGNRLTFAPPLQGERKFFRVLRK